jgi:hypothetical protein
LLSLHGSSATRPEVRAAGVSDVGGGIEPCRLSLTHLFRDLSQLHLYAGFDGALPDFSTGDIFADESFRRLGQFGPPLFGLLFEPDFERIFGLVVSGG